MPVVLRGLCVDWHRGVKTALGLGVGLWTGRPQVVRRDFGLATRVFRDIPISPGPTMNTGFS